MTELLDQCPTQAIQPSLGYGQRPVSNGFHIMQTISENWVECLTGLGATGTEIMISLQVARQILKPTPSHPIIPLIRIAFPGDKPSKAIKDALDDFDVILSGEPSEWTQKVLDEIVEIASQNKLPKHADVWDFQICRGPLGISM